MAIVPAPHTFVDGVYSTSEANTYIRDPLLFLMRPPTARLRQLVGQTLTNGVFTAITFTTHDVDQDWAGGSGHSDSVNTSRYTANYAGWYLCTGGVSFAVSAAGNRGAYWYVNGTAVNAVESIGASAAAINFGTVARGELVYLNVGDYVELFGYQSSGGVLNTQISGSTGSTANLMWRSN